MTITGTDDEVGPEYTQSVGEPRLNRQSTAISFSPSKNQVSSSGVCSKKRESSAEPGLDLAALHEVVHSRIDDWIDEAVGSKIAEFEAKQDQIMECLRQKFHRCQPLDEDQTS
jgi:hypothetical protein